MKQDYKSFGRNSWVSPKASIYGAERIEIGDNVRIDDFCILSAGEGGIKIGSHIHIACYSSLIGKELIQIDDYAGIGARCSIYSSSDDFSGNALVGPTIDAKYTNVRSAKVWMRKYSVICCGVVILPGVTLDEGCAVGAMSLVKKDLGSYKIYGGNPIRFIRDRETRMTKHVQEVYLEAIDWHVPTDEPYYGGK